MKSSRVNIAMVYNDALVFIVTILGRSLHYIKKIEYVILNPMKSSIGSANTLLTYSKFTRTTSLICSLLFKY